MSAAPAEIDGATVVAYAVVDESVRPTGGTVHRVAGDILEPAARLAICCYEHSAGYYLFYCDYNWQVLTDTYHDNLEAAKSQAEFEYSGITPRWRTLI
jgi:hypothetical protein